MALLRIWFALLLAAGAVLGAAGCRGGGEVADESALTGDDGGPAAVLTRAEVMKGIRDNMNRLATLSAQVRVRVVQQGSTVPAPREKNWARARLGKVYEKIFPMFEVRGYVAIEQARRTPVSPNRARELIRARLKELENLKGRPLDEEQLKKIEQQLIRQFTAEGFEEPKKTRFFADFPGSDRMINFLALGDEFWIVLPDPEAGPRGRRILKGMLDRTWPRPELYFSLRPQDIGDLLLYDEFFRDPEKEPGIEFMEIWPRHYILTVLRADRPGAVCSRIWVNRRTLMATHHQLFDADGTILAEARFTNYMQFAAKGGESVALPTRAIFIWPREQLVLDVTLATVSVNKALEQKVFRRPSERGADVQTIYPRQPRSEKPPPAAPPAAPGAGG